jgi:hypothetical protein
MNQNFLLDPGPGSPFASRNQQLIAAAQQLGAVPDQAQASPVLPVQQMPMLPDGTLLTDDPMQSGYGQPQQAIQQPQASQMQAVMPQPKIEDTGSSTWRQIGTLALGGPRALFNLLEQDDKKAVDAEQRQRLVALGQAMDAGTATQADIISVLPTQAGVEIARQYKNRGRGQYAPQTEYAKINYDQQQGLITQEQADAARQALGKGNPKITEGEGSLRKEFDGVTKTFREDIRPAYNRIQAAASNPSAAGDLALIFNYMKMLDPGSTVREGEFATAQNAAGIPDIIMNQYNRIVSGERLNPNQRTDFLSQAGKQYESAIIGYDEQRNRYRSLASGYGYNPGNVVNDFDVKPKTASSNANNRPTLTPQQAAAIKAQRQAQRGG